MTTLNKIITCALFAFFVTFNMGSKAQIRDIDTGSEQALLDTIVVRPQPVLFRAEKDGKVLWLLVVQRPVPKKMVWNRVEIDNLVSQSQEILLEPEVVTSFDVGVFGMISLAYKSRGLRSNPGGKSLKQILPASQHNRWLRQTQRFGARASAYEKLRPFFAGQELYAIALESYGLTHEDAATPGIRSIASQKKIKVSTPRLNFKISDWKRASKMMAEEHLSEDICFDLMLRRIESLPKSAIEQSRAWAAGDLESFRNSDTGQWHARCANLLYSSKTAAENGGASIDDQLKRAWVTRVEAAMSQNKVTFAILQADVALSHDGYLNALKARGISVDE